MNYNKWSIRKTLLYKRYEDEKYNCARVNLEIPGITVTTRHAANSFLIHTNKIKEQKEKVFFSFSIFLSLFVFFLQTDPPKKTKKNIISDIIEKVRKRSRIFDDNVGRRRPLSVCV